MSSVPEKGAKEQRLGVSVIICCYTERRLSDTREAVTSVRRQALAPEEIILVVDNNPELYERLRREMGQWALVVLNEGPAGVSGSRNAGIDLAHADLVAFLDDDAVAEPEWLVRLTGLFRDPNVVAVGGRAVLGWVEGRPSWFPEELDWTVGGSVNWLPLVPTIVRNPHGFNMCFRREVFEVVGGFATEIGGMRHVPRSGEEADLCLRVRQRWPTAKVVWEPSAVVVHKVPPSKVRFSLILWRAYCEGLCKSWVQHSAQANGKDDALSTERAYLRHIVSRSLPSRLASFWDLKGVVQTVAILLCIMAAGAGYGIGEVGNMSRSLRSARKTQRAFRR